MTINAPATDNSMQDIASRLEAVLDSENAPADESVDLINEVPNDDSGLPDGDDSDLDEDGSEEDTEEEDGDEEDGDEPEDYSISGLLGVEDDRISVNDEGKVLLTAIVDGESKQVPIEDLVVSYQTQGHVNNKSIALENERKEFDGQKVAYASEFTQKMEQAGQLATIAGDLLVKDFNAIDWDKLRSVDAGQWTALRQEYSERADTIKRMQQQISGSNQQLMQQQRATAAQAQAEHLKAEHSQMIAANPAWSDSAKMKSDLSDMRDFVKSDYGFSNDDLEAVTDHRLISLIKDAMSFRKGVKTAESKKVKKVPSFQKPNAARQNGKALTKARATKAKRAAVKRTGNINDVAALLEDRM